MDPLTIEILTEKHKDKILKMFKKVVDSLKKSLSNWIDSDDFNKNDNRFIRFSKEEQKQWLNIPEVEEMIFEEALGMCEDNALNEISWGEASELIIDRITK